MHPRTFARVQILAIALAAATIGSCGSTPLSPASPAQPRPSDPGVVRNAPAPFSASPELLAELKAALDETSAGRNAAAAPLHGTLELAAAPRNDGGLELSWQHSQRGDYNLDGAANISDLAVLGGYFGASSSDAIWDEARRADGDGNGALTIADVAPIGSALGQATYWYAVTTDNPAAAVEIPGWGVPPEAGWYYVAVVYLSAGQPDVFNAARSYSLTVPDWQPGTYRVTAYDSQDRAGLSAEAAAHSLRGDWWMEGRDYQNTSLSAHAGPQTSHVAWSVPGLGSTNPVLDAFGNIYIGAGYGLSCVRPGGDVAWSYATDYKQVSTTPAIGHNGFVYFGADDGILRALRPGGSLAWLYAAGGGKITSPVAISPAGRIFFGCEDGRLVCLNPDGTLAWTWQSEEPITERVVFDSQGRVLTLAINTADGYGRSIHLLSPDGQYLRRVPYSTGADQPLITSVVIGPGGPAVESAVFMKYDYNYGGEVDVVPLDLIEEISWDFPPLSADTGAYRTIPPALLPNGEGILFVGDYEEGLSFWNFNSAPVTGLGTPDTYIDGLSVDGNGIAYFPGRENNADPILAVNKAGDLQWSSYVNGFSRYALDDETLYVVAYPYAASYAGLTAIGAERSGSPPDAPTEVRVADWYLNPDQLGVSWTKAEGADYYEVYREGSATPLAVVTPATNYPYGHLYLDADVSQGNVYSYYVIAVNRFGTSAPSATVSGSPRLAQVTDVVANDGAFPDRVEITWTKVDGATSYMLGRQRVGETSQSWVTLGDVDSYSDTSLTDWDEYQYSVRAYGAYNNGPLSLADTGSITRGSGPSGPGEWRMHDHDLAQTRRAGVPGPASPPAVVAEVLLGNLDRKPQFAAYASDGSGLFGDAANSSRGLAFHPDATPRYSAPRSFYFSSVADDGAQVCHAFRADGSPMLTLLNPDGTDRAQFEEVNVYGGSPLPGGDYIGAEPFAVTRFGLDGSIAWRYTVPLFDRSPQMQPPLVGTDGSVYFATRGKIYLSGAAPNQGAPGNPGAPGQPPPPPPTHYLYALNPDGSFKWRFDQQGYIYDLALGSGGTVYLSSVNGSYFTNSTEGRIIAVAADGTQAWEHDALEVNRLCIAADGKLVFSYAGGVTALHPDGSVAWDYPTGVWTSELLLDSADNSYFYTAAKREDGSGNDITLHSLDSAGGERWSLLLADAYYTYALALRDDGALQAALERRPAGQGGTMWMMLLK